jgi:hypothetical protein
MYLAGHIKVVHGPYVAQAWYSSNTSLKTTNNSSLYFYLLYLCDLSTPYYCLKWKAIRVRLCCRWLRDLVNVCVALGYLSSSAPQNLYFPSIFEKKWNCIIFNLLSRYFSFRNLLRSLWEANYLNYNDFLTL